MWIVFQKWSPGDGAPSRPAGFRRHCSRSY